MARTNRRLWPLGALLALVAMASGLRPCAAEIVQPRGMICEALPVPFIQPNHPTLRLEAMMLRPAAAGHYPLVVISHGSPRQAGDAKAKTSDWADWIADDFVRRGFVAATVLRRGYGHSEGVVTEGYGTCKDPDYRAAGLASAQDIVQAVGYFQKQPYVDPDRILLIGVSAGGFGSIAAASLAPPGLVGVINFAGGRGSTSADVVCNESDLIDAYGAYGRTVRVPSLWIYSRNDHFFSPELAQRMFAAFRTSGGASAELIIAPPYKQDGHNLIFGQPMWRDAVYDFLKRNGLPFAAPSLPPPRATGEIARAFADYLATPNYEKAFVVGEGGSYGWASGRASLDEALAVARENCANHCNVVYALDDTLAAAGAGPAAQSSTPPPATKPVGVTPESAGAEMIRRLLKQ